MAGLRKRSVLLAGHATSVALEPEFWAAIERISAARCISLNQLVLEVDQTRGERPLASALRVTALENASVRPRGGGD
jgi:predicted DNA-binding ribbon-helix-helix protein